jgi:hypothetical protein
MTCMIDKWHDRYHSPSHRDLGCIYCQEEIMWEAEAEGDLQITLPMIDVDIDLEAEWGAWLEATYDPDNERLEDLDI